MRAAIKWGAAASWIALAILTGWWCMETLFGLPEYDRRSRLAAVVDGGKMEEFLFDESQREAILRWVRQGAPLDGWAQVSVIFQERCVSCHYSDSAPLGMLALDRYESAASTARVLPVLREKITGGTMGKYLASVEEQQAILRFIDRGAIESEWDGVERILARHCVHCHNPDTGVPGLVYLDVYASVARLAAPASPARPRWALATPPAVVLLSLAGVIGLWRKCGIA